MLNQKDKTKAFGAALLLQMLLYLLREAILRGITALLGDLSGYLYLQRIVSSFVSAAVFLLPCLFYLKCTSQSVSELLHPCLPDHETNTADGKKERKKTPPLLKTVSVISGAALVLNAVNLVGLLTDTVYRAIGWSIPKSVFPNGTAMTVLAFASTVLITPIIEELLFRGVALNALLPFGVGRAVMVSGALFALMHCRLYSLPYAFCAGCLIAVYAIKENSIVYAVLLHFFNNLVSFLTLITEGYAGEAARRGFGNALLFISLPFAVIGLAELALWIYRGYRDTASRKKGGESKTLICGETVLYACIAFALCILSEL